MSDSGIILPEAPSVFRPALLVDNAMLPCILPDMFCEMITKHNLELSLPSECSISGGISGHDHV